MSTRILCELKAFFKFLDIIKHALLFLCSYSIFGAGKFSVIRRADSAGMGRRLVCLAACVLLCAALIQLPAVTGAVATNGESECAANAGSGTEGTCGETGSSPQATEYTNQPLPVKRTINKNKKSTSASGRQQQEPEAKPKAKPGKGTQKGADGAQNRDTGGKGAASYSFRELIGLSKEFASKMKVAKMVSTLLLAAR